MKMQVVGLSHQNASIGVREGLAFSPQQARDALAQLRDQLADVEVVLLSTCNRVELYTAAEGDSMPTRFTLAEFLARFHGREPDGLAEHLYQRTGEAAIRHLFTVASSLDSMVVGEAQVLSQVKQAYQLATEEQATGPLTHAAFQAALKAARRVAGETAVHQRRVSVPSVAVADFAQQIFERLDDKNTLVIGAGEMAEETLRYLRAEGARDVTVVNRSARRAEELARRWGGRIVPWEGLLEALAQADLVISTTGAEEPVVTRDQFRAVEQARYDRPLFVLDLAVPRDFDPAIGDWPSVYLYSIDDLRQACDRNRLARDRELPAAMRIIEQETRRFMADWHHRVTGPVIQRLRKGWDKPKEEEVKRLFNKLPDLDERARAEIRQSFDRLVNKLMHPPLESLRDEARHGIPSALVEALAKLFQLKD
jgi:glutamyl-tRNA reductase